MPPLVLHVLPPGLALVLFDGDIPTRETPPLTRSAQVGVAWFWVRPDTLPIEFVHEPGLEPNPLPSLGHTFLPFFLPLPPKLSALAELGLGLASLPFLLPVAVLPGVAALVELPVSLC